MKTSVAKLEVPNCTFMQWRKFIVERGGFPHMWRQYWKHSLDREVLKSREKIRPNLFSSLKKEVQFFSVQEAIEEMYLFYLVLVR